MSEVAFWARLRGWVSRGFSWAKGRGVGLAGISLLIDIESILEGCKLPCWSKWAADQQDLGILGLNWWGQGGISYILLARIFQHEG